MEFHTNLDDHQLAQRDLARVGLGIGLSVAVHVLWLMGYIGSPANIKIADPTPAARIEVRLVQEKPPVAVPEPAIAAAAPAKTRTPRKPAKPAVRDLIALPDNTPDKSADEAQFTVTPPQEGPKFDPDAARKLARQMASEPDPARAGTAVGQIPPKPLATETRAARLIAGAKRADCLKQSGNLLTPLFWLLDGKDSGCKF